MPRPTFPEYGVRLAIEAASRSEDENTKVGSVAFDKDWNTLGTFYNGFLPKQDVDPAIWKDRDLKNKHIIHAETWLVSKTKNGAVQRVCSTHSPCYKCAVMLAAHGVKEVYYAYEYHRDQEFKEIFNFYGIKYEETGFPVTFGPKIVEALKESSKQILPPPPELPPLQYNTDGIYGYTKLPWIPKWIKKLFKKESVE